MNEGDGPFFLDSNILIYAFDTAEPRKRARSRALIESLPAEDIVLSAQVVNEFYFTVTRKLGRKVPAAEAFEAVRGLSGFAFRPSTTASRWRRWNWSANTSSPSGMP
jgi:predicted nucleic acid-binding protein